MKIKRILALIICALTLFAFGCNETTDYEGQIKVTFCLEGGIYQNSKRDIVHYYPFEEGLIVNPEELSGVKINKGGYNIEGWYKTKTGEGENVEYSDKWNFSSDKVGAEGVTLYAKWVPNIIFTYDVCYYNDAGETVVLGSYPVKAGEKFEDYANFAKKRTDGVYTPLNYVDAGGNAWDFSFAHPGGEQSLAIKVYVNYLKGDFSLVSTARELKASTGKNIYLLNDIDLNGEEFNFGDYKYTLLGNGHTISNFKIKYDPSRSGIKEDLEDDSKKSLYVSLFGNLNGATVKDVNFKDVKIDVNTALTTTYKIYLAPLGIKAVNATVENVTFEGSYTLSKLPENRTEDEMLNVTNAEPFVLTEGCTVNNVTVTLAKSEKE